ncbi:MAG: hypothetical protein GY696_25275 [Gammaproteobacteria bacterium]|nr:hypothetical protein [Gammaproteobacteria bacterium]
MSASTHRGPEWRRLPQLPRKYDHEMTRTNEQLFVSLLNTGARRIDSFERKILWPFSPEHSINRHSKPKLLVPGHKATITAQFQRAGYEFHVNPLRQICTRRSSRLNGFHSTAAYDLRSTKATISN